MEALAIGPEDNIVCIASGGCNMLSYLTAGPASITAVDLLPAHVALNRMKLAAAAHLPDHESFFGCSAAPMSRAMRRCSTGQSRRISIRRASTSGTDGVA